MIDPYYTNVASRNLSNGLNEHGRAYPDLAAQSWNLVGYGNNVHAGGSGTSASTPIVGAMVGLMNNALMNAGKKRLGFLNPTLYKLHRSTPGAFVDITAGNNAYSDVANNVGAPSLGCQDNQGFSALPGWDATSGLGYIHYPTVLEAVMATMPDEVPKASVDQAAKEKDEKMITALAVITALLGVGLIGALGMLAGTKGKLRQDQKRQDQKQPVPYGQTQESLSQASLST